MTVSASGEMFWNHRVMRYKDGSLEIVEMIYEDGGMLGWVDANVYAAPDEGIDSLREQLRWMASALDRPVIDDWRTDEQRAVAGGAQGVHGMVMCICLSPGACLYSPQSPCRVCNQSRDLCEAKSFLPPDRGHTSNLSYPAGTHGSRDARSSPAGDANPQPSQPTAHSPVRSAAAGVSMSAR